MKHLLLTSTLLGLLGAGSLMAPATASAQATTRRHLVQFRDKNGTPFTVSQPQQFLGARSVQRRQRQNIAVTVRDLPPTPAYLQQVRATGATVLYQTRWLNGVIVQCDSTKLAAIQALPCVLTAQTLNRGGRQEKPPRVPHVSARARRPLSVSYYGAADAQVRQIGADQMHTRGFWGQGMHIAVFDAGFPGVDQVPAFDSLRAQGRIASTFDFIDRDQGVYEKYDHGTEVLSCIAGNQPNTYVGTAPRATFHLCITEDVRSEHHIEEANWLVAAEYADSVGADIISSSLGYTTFDFPSASYSYNDMNGRTALSTRAADLAAGVGILVVNSAGNDGFSPPPSQHIGAPADGDSVLAVGAVDSLGGYAGFSSQGPSFDGRIKPNLSAMGQMTAVVDPSGIVFRGNGTSFSCPVLAGMAAGFWQAHPTLTARQVRLYLQASATQATNPDALLGYGIPLFGRADSLATAGVLGIKPATAALTAPELLPNPVPGATFGIKLPTHLVGVPLTVRVTDATGRRLFEQTRTASAGEAQLGINLGQRPLPPGTYLCQLLTPDGARYTLRFVKE